MRKLISVCMVFAIVLQLCACGSPPDSSVSSGSPPTGNQSEVPVDISASDQTVPESLIGPPYSFGGEETALLEDAYTTATEYEVKLHANAKLLFSKHPVADACDASLDFYTQDQFMPLMESVDSCLSATTWGDAPCVTEVIEDGDDFKYRAGLRKYWENEDGDSFNFETFMVLHPGIQRLLFSRYQVYYYGTDIVEMIDYENISQFFSDSIGLQVSPEFMKSLMSDAVSAQVTPTSDITISLDVPDHGAEFRMYVDVPKKEGKTGCFTVFSFELLETNVGDDRGWFY